MNAITARISVLSLALVAAGCAGPRNFGERLEARAEQALAASAEYRKGGRMVEKGDARIVRGQKMIRDGQAMIESGERLKRDGEALQVATRQAYCQQTALQTPECE